MLWPVFRLHDAILDALDALGKDEPHHWMSIQHEIKRQYGRWIKGTTLTRKLRKMAEDGAIRRDEQGRFWR